MIFRVRRLPRPAPRTARSATGSMDCGLVCLSFVGFLLNGRMIPTAVLRLSCGRGDGGISALGLIQSGRHHGLTGKGFRSDSAGLARLTCPLVANVNSARNEPHWIVVVEFEQNERALVMDPETADVRWWGW